jgi:hypothetical protein
MLDHFCRHVANDIKEKLPKLSICQNYFAMLDVICGLSYYFSSLKKHELMPKLSSLEVNDDQKCLGMFPPYPKTKLVTEVNKTTLWDFIKQLDNNSIGELRQYLLGNASKISPTLQTALVNSIKNMLPKNSLKFGGSELNELVIILTNNALKCVNQLKEELNSEYLGDLLSGIKKAKQNITEHEKMLLELKQNVETARRGIIQKEKDNLNTQLSQLDNQNNEQYRQIENTNIGYNQYITYGGRNYQSHELSSLKSKMRDELYIKMNEIKNKATKDNEVHWNKYKVELDNEYKQNLNKINDHIKNVRQSTVKMEEEYERLNNLKRKIVTDPTSIDVAKEIKLNLPSVTKNLSTLDVENKEQLVRINGGTGFELSDKEILSNTALVTNLNHQLTTGIAKNSDSPVVESWKSIKVNGANYQTFYISHDRLNEQNKKQIENSILKPNMAKTDVEKRLITLASQQPNSQQIIEISALLESNKQLVVDKTDAYGNNAVQMTRLTPKL